jgi:hypothetical protein
MTSTALVGRSPHMAMGSLEDPEALGRVLAASGYFQDAKDAAQAVVKVLAGAELGFGPIASMTGVYIVKGRVTLSANLLAAAIKRHPRYDFRVKELTNDRAEVLFLEDGSEIGTSEFTMEDARAAGLAGGDNWRKFPRNMLFARAVSNGAKFFVPDVFSGAPVYTPDELGADVDGETGDVIDAAVDKLRATPPPTYYDAPGGQPTREDVSAMARASAPQTSTVESPPPSEPAPSAVANDDTTARESERGPASDVPHPEKDSTEPLTAQEAATLTAYLHRIETPEPMWRMALLAHGADSIADLTQGQAHELLTKARQRYGTPEKA